LVFSPELCFLLITTKFIIFYQIKPVVQVPGLIIDKLDFFRDHSTRVQDIEANKLETDQDRIKFYLNNCADETKVQYKEFIDSALTSDVLKQQCELNAKGFGLPAEVEITEK